MYKLILLPLAREDIREAAKWYNRRKKGLGKRFTAQVREKMRLIRRHPKSAPIRYEAVRTAVLDQFPFMIHYTVDETKQTIVVAAVLHTSRDPEEWKRR